jgi:hypothetical protein
MKFQILSRRECELILFLGLSLLGGCASRGSVMGTEQLTIDKIPGGQASILDVYARNTAEGIDLVGKVQFKNAMLGTPSDDLGITIIDPAGKVLYTGYTRYYRYGKPTKKSDIFRFSTTIPLPVPRRSVVRLVNAQTS